jgi:hypothetical protein
MENLEWLSTHVEYFPVDQWLPGYRVLSVFDGPRILGKPGIGAGRRQRRRARRVVGRWNRTSERCAGSPTPASMSVADAIDESAGSGPISR